MKRYCLHCGVYYSPNVGENGRMPKGYKVCPVCKSTDTKEWIRPKFKSIYGRNHHSEPWNEALNKDRTNIPPTQSADAGWDREQTIRFNPDPMLAKWQVA